jgi:DNA-binding NarL/FixJ family response regulator
MPLKILLADDHLVLLAGMRALLEREGYQVVADVSDGRQAVNLARRLQPHIAVLDSTMPGLNGLAAAQKIRRLCPETKVIILTMHKETPYVIEALDAEVMGYVLKTQAAQDLLAAINSVAANNVYLSQGISDVVVDAYRNKNGPDGHRLTLREREVLQLIAEGHRTRKSPAS